MANKPIVYFTGPDRLLPNGAKRLADAAALAERYGFQAALLPPEALDLHTDAPTAAAARMRVMDSCDLVLADTRDFRGTEPFAACGFDLGYCYGKDKKLYCYMEDARSCEERYPGPTTLNEKGRKVDLDGFGFESGPLNLMLLAPSTVVEGTLEDALARAAADFFPQEV